MLARPAIADSVCPGLRILPDFAAIFGERSLQLLVRGRVFGALDQHTGNPGAANSFMQLLINGKPQIVPEPLTLAQLIEHLGMKGDRVAVELNREIVSRAQWSQTPLSNDDRLEIVHFVGGG